jgi:RNA polymerase sigma-70 factor (ECF subfamily)
MSETKSNSQENFSLSALQNGDRAEFARVVNAYSDQIYRLALKMLRDPQDAEDILQETFIKAYHGFSGFKGNAKVSTWLYRIATNEALMLIRKRKENVISLQKTVETDEGESIEPVNLTDWCCLPESELLSTEAIEYLDRAIEIISENLRAVFLLRDIEGLSTAETADVLGISEGAVKTRLSRARLKLRELLSGYYGNKLAGSPIHSQTGEKEGR